MDKIYSKLKVDLADLVWLGVCSGMVKVMVKVVFSCGVRFFIF